MKKLYYSEFNSPDSSDQVLSESTQGFATSGAVGPAQLILEHLHDPIMALDADCRVISLNRSCASLLCLEPEDILDVQATLFIDCTKEELLESLEHLSGRSFKTQVKDKDGYYIYWHFRRVDDPASPVKMIAQGKIQRRRKKKVSFLRAMMSSVMSRYYRLSHIKNNDVYYPKDLFD